MSESMSSPWIRDYLIDVAETHGVQLYNTPPPKGKKRVQLINFLTYHPDSYVWAWISDKDHSVSVRFSKDAADAYKNKHGRNIFDSRFSLVFISSYRPIFSPRPLGPNAAGHTPMSHISLEVDCVTQIGIGPHLFGDPRDIESDKNIREWVLGLREDGGGGNVLKLRKQQKLAQNTRAPPAPPAPPALPPLVTSASVSHHQTTKVAEDVAKPKPERPQDFKRAYAKRWRVIELNSWKFAIKPAVEESSAQTNPSHPPKESLPDTVGQPQLRQDGPSERPTSPCRTPSRASLQRRQGTPTDWSPSDRGSPSPRSLDEVGTSALTEEIQPHCDEPMVPPTSPSDANGPTAADTTSDTHSIQPPTPAQRIKRSPLPYSSPPHSSPEITTYPSQLRSSPLPPSSSLPFPSSSFPLPVGIRKNLQRKVPHPGLPVPPTKQGPVQILVPNSDTSGTGSSQSISQSQPFSQSQRQPVLPSSLAKEFKPRDVSLPINGDNEGQNPTEAVDGSAENHADRPSVPGIEIPEVGKSGTGVQYTSKGDTNVGHHENRSAVNNAKLPSTLQDSRQPSCLPTIQDLSFSQRDAVGFPSHTSTQLSEQTSRSSMHSLFSDSEDEGRAESSQAPKPLANRTEVHAVVSPALGLRHDVEAWKEPSFIAKNKGKGKRRAVEEPSTPTPRVVDKKRRRSAHPETPLPKRARAESPKTCKAASGTTSIDIFGDKDRQDSGTSTVGKTRRNGRSSSSAAGTTELVAPSLALQSPLPKRARAELPKVCKAASGTTPIGLFDDKDRQDNGTSTIGKTRRNGRSSSSAAGTTELVAPSLAPQSSRPRLANFSVNFEKISLGARTRIPMRPHPDIRRILLTTGRVRNYKEVEEDGSVYIYQ